MEELKCKKCKGKLLSNYNYCPGCGEPQSSMAKQKEELKLQTAGLLKLQELVEENPNSKEILLAVKRMINK